MKGFLLQTKINSKHNYGISKMRIAYIFIPNYFFINCRVKFTNIRADETKKRSEMNANRPFQKFKLKKLNYECRHLARAHILHIYYIFK